MEIFIHENTEFDLNVQILNIQYLLSDYCLQYCLLFVSLHFTRGK